MKNSLLLVGFLLLTCSLYASNCSKSPHFKSPIPSDNVTPAMSLESISRVETPVSRGDPFEYLDVKKSDTQVFSDSSVSPSSVNEFCSYVRGESEEDDCVSLFLTREESMRLKKSYIRQLDELYDALARKQELVKKRLGIERRQVASLKQQALNILSTRAYNQYVSSIPTDIFEVKQEIYDIDCKLKYISEVCRQLELIGQILGDGQSKLIFKGGDVLMKSFLNRIASGDTGASSEIERIVNSISQYTDVSDLNSRKSAFPLTNHSAFVPRVSKK